MLEKFERPELRILKKHEVDPTKFQLNRWDDLLKIVGEEKNCSLSKEITLFKGHYLFCIENAASYTVALEIAKFFVEELADFKHLSAADILWDVTPTQEIHNGNYTISAFVPDRRRISF